eukprot:4685933-Amphidinium_carterae.1
MLARDAVMNTSEVFHEGWLLTYALKKGYINNGNLNNSDVLRQLRAFPYAVQAVLDTVDEVDTSPLTSAIRVIYKEKWSLLSGLHREVMHSQFYVSEQFVHNTGASEVLYANLFSSGVHPGPTVGPMSCTHRG